MLNLPALLALILNLSALGLPQDLRSGWKLHAVPPARGCMIAPSIEIVDLTNFSEFELEFNSLVRKHVPHWQALDITKL